MGSARTLLESRLRPMASFAMETRDIFENLSPLDHRYWLANREIFDSLSSILSEKAQLRWCARVEAALLETHLELRDRSDPELFALIKKIAETIDPSEVYAEEERTRHNIRALVNVFQSKVAPEVASLVHLARRARISSIPPTDVSSPARRTSRASADEAFLFVGQQALHLAFRDLDTPTDRSNATSRGRVDCP